MKDSFGRKIEYLRLSVTDRCNLRCVYCMGKDGVVKKHHSDMMTIEELTEIAIEAIKTGIRKIRLTGGEPLVRKGILTLCENIKAFAPEIELGMTTNGTLLPMMAADLKRAGVDRLNISLDTLRPDRYADITRIGNLAEALRGLDAAEKAGFHGIKINTVLLGGINTDEIKDIAALAKTRDITVRFIELMPMKVTQGWEKERFLSSDSALKELGTIEKLCDEGVSAIYQISGYRGKIGSIAPMTHRFCDHCNKIRVTADGHLKPCLHSDEEISLKGLHGEALRNALAEGIRRKPLSHHLDQVPTDARRNMNEIGG